MFTDMANNHVTTQFDVALFSSASYIKLKIYTSCAIIRYFKYIQMLYMRNQTIYDRK